MGYPAALTPIWLRYAEQFPVTRHLTYLNHAAIAPLARPAAEAMIRLAEEACRWGSYHYADWLAAYDGLRRAAARLIGSGADEIAIVKNTSEGIATVANGLDWRPGDIAVVFREEFPANYFPWVRLERRGVRLRWLSIYDPLEAIEEACRGARLLAASHVNYLSGYRIDLEAYGQICRRHGCLFFVDAIQGLGAFPIDVRRAAVDALAADGHKWLLGPEGCGILYVRREVLDSIDPVEFGWTNVAGYADYASRDMTLRSDAGRYECGTLNTIGCFGLRAAIEFLLEVSIEAIAPAVLALADRLREGALEKGYEVLGPGDEAHRSGIVSIRKPGLDSRAVVRGLRERGIIASPRQGWIRLSPHFYIPPEAIETTLEALP